MTLMTKEEKELFREYFATNFLLLDFCKETPKRKLDGSLSKWVSRYERIKVAENSNQFLNLKGTLADMFKALEEELVIIRNDDPWKTDDLVHEKIMKNIRMRKIKIEEEKKQRKLTKKLIKDKTNLTMLSNEISTTADTV
tara:strand:- start:764 stop:1183 length:420 start_codon:yes stop_codon:yes gene_type:complete